MIYFYVVIDFQWYCTLSEDAGKKNNNAMLLALRYIGLLIIVGNLLIRFRNKVHHRGEESVQFGALLLTGKVFFFSRENYEL